MGVIDSVGTAIINFYSSVLGALPSWAQQALNLFLLVILIFIYAIFIWKFYRFIARKNLISLNLNQYNKSEHQVFSKIIAAGFYLLEYILILPFLVFLWFGIFTVFLILLTDKLDVANVLVISATVVGAIRLISYVPRYGQNLAKEISKLLPFTLLGIAMTKQGFFDFERILTHLTEIPTFFSQITLYLLFIIFLEIILRIFDLLITALGFKDPRDDEDKEED